MRQFIIAFFLVLIPTILWGQTIPLNVEDIGNSLKTTGIDTFIVYKNYSPGSYHTIIIDPALSENEIRKSFCQQVDAVYTLYMQKGQLYIQKRDECHFYKTKSIDSCYLFSSYINDFNKIANEKILPNSSIDAKGDTLHVSIDHSNITDLYLSCGVTRKIITIDSFDLQTTNHITENTNGNKNINYEHNVNTKTKNLLVSIADYLLKQEFTIE